MEKLKSFVSKKLLVSMVLIFWVPLIVIKMVEAHVDISVISMIVGGLFSIGGVYNLVQGMIDKVQK